MARMRLFPLAPRFPRLQGIEDPFMAPVVRFLSCVGVCAGLLAVLPCLPASAQAAKDQEQIAPEPESPTIEAPTPPQSETEPDGMSLGDVPEIETVELTPETARKAVDAFSMIREKYADTPIYEYEDLEEFVDKTEAGKKLEADVKTFGFANVTEWNTAITSVGLAYSAMNEDPSDNVEQQIAEIKADSTLAQDMKDRMVKSLSAMIPSENNKKIIADLAKDSAYSEKLKLLSEEE